jgi:hypothetical protein
MLTTDPTVRISATEALRHPWIVNAVDDSHLEDAHSRIKETVDDKTRRGSSHQTNGVLGFLFKRGEKPN